MGPDIGSLKGSSVTMGRFSVGVMIRARQTWTDDAGRVCPADTLGRIQQMVRERFDPHCPIDVRIETPDGGILVLRYALRRGGPRFDELFEALTPPWGTWPPPDEVAAAPSIIIAKPATPVVQEHPKPRPSATPAPPAAARPPHALSATGGARGDFDCQLDHALALVRAGDAERATREWRAYCTTLGPMRDWGEAAGFGQHCSRRAMALRQHGRIGDTTAWRWLREQSMSWWYSWAGQATSGGEGTAMMVDVRRAQRAFDEAEQEHRRLGGAPFTD